MKNSILMNTVFGAGLGLTLLAGAAFAGDLPTAESEMQEACADAISVKLKALKEAEAEVATGQQPYKTDTEADRLYREKFSRYAAERMLQVVSNMAEVQEAVGKKATTIAESYVTETAKLESMKALDENVRMDASFRMERRYRRALMEAVTQGLIEAGFTTGVAPYPSSDDIQLLKNGKETGAVIRISNQANYKKSIKQFHLSYFSEETFPRGPNNEGGYLDGRITIMRLSILNNEDVRFHVTVNGRQRNGEKITLIANEGTYGRAGIKDGDTEEVKISKLASRFSATMEKILFERNDQKLKDDIASAKEELAKLQASCANPYPNP